MPDGGHRPHGAGRARDGGRRPDDLPGLRRGDGATRRRRDHALAPAGGHGPHQGRGEEAALGMRARAHPHRGDALQGRGPPRHRAAAQLRLGPAGARTDPQGGVAHDRPAQERGEGHRQGQARVALHRGRRGREGASCESPSPRPATSGSTSSSSTTVTDTPP